MRGPCTPYETGLNQLLDCLGSDHPRYNEVLVYQQRLQENIHQYRLYGDSQDLRAERARIVGALNRLAMDTVGKSFNELCKPAQISQVLTMLREAVQAPHVKAALAAFQADFQAACRHIDTLAGYKGLHDQLHRLQFQCYNCIVFEATRFPRDEMSLDILREHEATLQEIVDRLRHIADQASFARDEVSWIQDLDQARESLHRAIESSNMEQLKRAIWLMHRVLFSQPSRINTHLYHSAHAVCLPDLVKALRSVRENLIRPDFDLERVRQFEAGVQALDSLSRDLTTLRNEHDEWQQVDLELRRIEANLDQDMELELSWPYLKAMVEPLYGDSTDEWARLLKADAEKLEGPIAAQDPAKAKQYFRRCRRQASNRFYQVDMELKELCDELRKIGEPLTAVLRMVE